MMRSLPANWRAALGDSAQAAGEGIPDRHVVVKSAHPSPLSIRGFAGSSPFRRANDQLAGRGLSPIDWELTQSNSSEEVGHGI